MSTHSLPKGPAVTTTSTRRRAFLVCSSIVAAGLMLFSPFVQDALSRVSPHSTGSAHRTSLITSPRRMLQRIATGKESGNTGFWHTRGADILSAANSPVRISGVNWSGFETTAAVPGGLQVQDYRSILRSIAAAGYNTVRIPFSNQMVESPSVPSNIAFENSTSAINEDLEGLDSLQILDRIIAAAGEVGLKVILDNHRSEAGSSAQGSGLWYTEQYPENAWIADWVALANRYQGNSTVIGFDLRNEPHNATSGGSCWDCGGAADWHLAAQRAGNAILHANANLLIFVEGTDQYNGESDFWGGNLAGVRTSPVRLDLPGRLVYSAHVYGPTEYAQSWFNAGTSPASLAALYHRHWGFISESGVAPVWIGEFGTPNSDSDVASLEPGSEGQWFQALIAYLQAHPSIGWTYWGINGEDRYGLFTADYTATPANRLKSAALASVRMPESPSSSATAAHRETATVAATIPHVPASPQPVTYAAAPVLQHATQFALTYAQPAATASAQRSLNHRVRTPDASNPAIDATVAEQVRRATEQALYRLPPHAE